MHIDGQTHHTTRFGGALSIFLMIGMLFIVYADVKKLALYKGDTISMFYKILNTDEIKPISR